MIRTLDFNGPKAPKRFELLYTALLAGGDGKGERNAQTIRKEARLLDQLDAISELAPVPVEANGHAPRCLTTPASISVPQEDFDLLFQYAEKTPWTPRASREAVDLWDWLSAAERKD